MKIKNTYLLSAILLLSSIHLKAFAADPAANFDIALFMKACIPNMGHPEKVRAWAESEHLNEIKDPLPLSVFVGDGGKGAAWAIAIPAGSFALSIRGTTEACAVWAKSADPVEVENNFKKIIDGTRRPGLDIKVIDDSTSIGPTGRIHLLVYQINAIGAQRGMLFSMTTTERSGGAFQTSLQAGVSTVTSP